MSGIHVVRIHEYVVKVLEGCGVERDTMRISGELTLIAEKYSEAEIDENEARRRVVKVCKELSRLANGCGKTLSPKKCVEDLMSIITATMGFRRARAMLRKLRRNH